MSRSVLLASCLALICCRPPCRGQIGGAKDPDPAGGPFEAALRKFGDPKVSRPQLLAKMEAIARKHPHSPSTAKVRKAIAILKKMVKEDEAHARKRVGSLANLSKKEQIAEWIFQLREQNGEQYDLPGHCDIFGDFHGLHRPKVPSPAHRLVDMGYDAVPQLIEALEDERFTRSVEVPHWAFGPVALRVGDCSAAVLGRIAGRSFSEGRVGGGKGPATKKKVRAWWKEFRAKGEKRMLIEGTEAGDWGSQEQAERLLAKYPDAALAAITNGVGRAKDEHIRSYLLAQARKVADPRVLDLFRKELKGPFLRSRVAAARSLYERGGDEGVRAMIREWRELPEDRAGLDPDVLIEFLARCPRREAIKALGWKLRSRPVHDRARVIDALEGRASSRHETTVPADILALIEKTLVECLHDTEQVRGWSVQQGDEQCTDPRVCDLAACALAKVWGRPRLFDLFAPVSTRDRQRIEVANVWRKEHRLTPLPLPGQPEVEPRGK
jgi:hypothetical protein